MKDALISAVAIGLLILGSAVSRGDDLALTPHEGVLLLHNGQLIDGTITAAGDHYDVNKTGGVIYIKRSEVEIACKTAHDCYLHKRKAIDSTRAIDHLDLAEWCLKNNLIEDGEQELGEARTADSTHPKIRLIDARLQLAKETPRPKEAPKTAEKASTLEQLDRMTRSLPAGAMESFTVTIQPMLLNYCAKSCHGPQSNTALRLERIHPTRLAGRFTSQRNLQAVLTLIDRDNPDASRLLQVLTEAHGARAEPIFSDREQSQYQQLVQWVRLVAGMRAVGAKPTLEERGAPLLQNVPRKGRAALEKPQAEPSAPKTPANDGEKAASDEDWSQSFPDQAGEVDKNQASAGGQGLRVARVRGQTVLRPAARVEAPEEFTPKDPFDPEIFNRRFFGK